MTSSGSFGMAAWPYLFLLLCFAPKGFIPAAYTPSLLGTLW
jgi:hypothetical protein